MREYNYLWAMSSLLLGLGLLAFGFRSVIEGNLWGVIAFPISGIFLTYSWRVFRQSRYRR